MRKILSQSFYARPVLKVAPDLLGKYLVTKKDGKILRGKIIEVEAYDGEKDLACHAAKGKTKRTSVMYGEPGVWYVYLCYGVHWMLNIVTNGKDYPAAVLIRGVDVNGTSLNGPGKVTKYFGITKNFNGKTALNMRGLWIEDLGEEIPKQAILRSPRIGVQYAGEVWAHKYYRFFIN